MTVKTKAQARKRLNEASVKLMDVYSAGLSGKLGAVPMARFRKLDQIAIELRRLVEAMK